MKKRIFMCLLALTISVFMLEGCDLSQLMPPGKQTSDEQSEDMAKDPIAEAETLIDSGKAQEADYLALADLYAEKSRIREQRDTLEQCWRLFHSEAGFSALEQITVNADEETEEIRNEIERLYQNLTVDGNTDEGVAMLISPEWFGQMMPRLKEGSRKYYYESGAGDTLLVQVGYTDKGAEYSKVWLTDSENKIKILHYETGTTHLTQTTTGENGYTGSFDSWLCDAVSGTTIHENGTLQDGICTGEYHAEAYFGKANKDAFTFWQGRDKLDFTSYKGDFGKDGVTAVSQSKVNKKGIVVYAYNEKKTDYLYVKEDSEKADSFVFRADVLGIENPPAFTGYEPVTEGTTIEGIAGTVNASDVQVRIYDNQIQWYDGASWHSMGDVDSYIEKDPFAAYAEKAAESEETSKKQKSPLADRIGEGQIVVPKAPASTQSSGSSNNSGSSSGSSSSGSSSSGSKSSGSKSSGSGSSGSKSSGNGSSGSKSSGSSSSGNKSTSGDGGDIEWTPDMM